MRGTFVAAGSELDVQLQQEQRGDTPSKTERKRASSELQDLGKQLLELPAGALAALELPDKLSDALAHAKTITDFEGRRRQIQFIGKLMRKLDDETQQAARAALDAQAQPSAEATAELHRIEAWRDRLLADDAALGDWIAQFPDTDVQALRALLRQARRDAETATDMPGSAARHGRAYRDIFKIVKAQLQGAETGIEAEPMEQQQDGS